ncbi:hypothetical protein [Nocardioides pacificus]
MTRRLLVVLLLLLLTPAFPAAAATDYVAEAAAALADGPVHLSDDSGAITPAQVDVLEERIDGWRDDVYVVVVPAAALSAMPGGSDPAQAMAFVDGVADEVGRDGVYVVSFSGAGTYGAAYGTDDRVGPIVAEEVDEHTLGQVDQILHGVLDGLGAPGGEGGFPWGWVLVVVILGACAGGIVAWWALSRAGARTGARTGARSSRQPSEDERWAGPADYRPAFAVHDDEHDTVEERAALAREDVTRLGEEIDREDLPTTDPAVAAHVGAGLDAYYDASRRVDALTTDEGLRQIGEVVEYARWQLACARARLSGDPPPPRRVPCFVDPAHGISVTDARWAPPGGVERPVPVCRTCLDRITG